MSQTLIASGDHGGKPAGLYSCKVALGGDLRQIVVKGADEPIPLAEVLLLQSLHGQDAVTGVIQERETELSPADVLADLQKRYGDKASAFAEKVNLTTMPFVNPKIMTREQQDQLDEAKEAILAGDEPFDVVTNNPLMPDRGASGDGEPVDEEAPDDTDVVDPDEPDSSEPDNSADPLAHLD